MYVFYKRVSTRLFWAVLFLSSNTAFAQETKKNLSELISLAQNHLPILKQKKLLTDVAKANVKDVNHSFLPQMRVSGQWNLGTDNSIAGSYLPLISVPSIQGGIRADNNFQPATGSIALAYGEYELNLLGLNEAKINAANATVQLYESDMVREMYLINQNVARLYFQILKNQSRLNSERQNIERYEGLNTLIQALVKSGLRPGSDTTTSKAEISKAKVGFNQTLGILNLLKEQLAFYTGIKKENVVLDSLTLNQKTGLINIVVDSTTNPLLELYKQRGKILVANQKVITKTYTPKFVVGATIMARGSSLQFGDNFKPFYEGFGYQRFNYVAGVAINYNLWNNLYKSDKLAINNLQIESNHLELEQQKLLLNSTAQQAEIASQTANTNFLELQIQIQAATESYNQKLAQYKSGLISLNDLRNATFFLYKTQTDQADVLNDFFIAELDKATATGALIQFIQTFK